MPPHLQPTKQKAEFLVVDDIENMRRAIRDMLQRGYGLNTQIDWARSGRDALAHLKTKGAKFVISDWTMPNMTGIELLQTIRNDAELFETPVLIVSDVISDDKLNYAIEEAADGILTKPFTENDIMESVREILKKRAGRSSMENRLTLLRQMQLKRKYDQAISMCKEILKEESHPEVLFLISECYYMQKDYENARWHLKHLLDDTASSKINYLYGRILMALGQNDEAITYLEKASQQNPFNLDRKVDIGSVYMELGMMDEANVVFDAVTKSNPTDMLLVKIGKTFLKHKDLERAGEFLKQTVEPLPDALTVFNNYALELKQHFRYDESIEQYRKCLNLIPNHPTVLFNMAMVYFETDKIPEAIKALRRAIAAKPDFEKAQKLLDHLEAKQSPPTAPPKKLSTRPI